MGKVVYLDMNIGTNLYQFSMLRHNNDWVDLILYSLTGVGYIPRSSELQWG